MTEKDCYYMELALRQSRKGWGYTKTNPLVGAVVVKDGKIIGQGYHQRYGEGHAEVNALSNIDDATGATIYVTLEPCSHYGKTPPCAELLIKRGIRRVVAAMEDPNPLVKGKGFSLLREAGIDVEVGVLEEKAKKVNEIFIKYITNTTPFTILKSAMSLDGKIATHTGNSKWITGQDARESVHQIRKGVSAIMVGINTVLKDDPLLTTRLNEEHSINPIRVIVDSKGKIPLHSKVLNTIQEAPTVIVTTDSAERENIKHISEKGAQVLMVGQDSNGKVNIREMLEKLRQMNINSLLLEGGGTLNWSFINSGLVDKYIFYISPMIIGGQKAQSPIGGDGYSFIDECPKLEFHEVDTIGTDLLITAYPRG